MCGDNLLHTFNRMNNVDVGRLVRQGTFYVRQVRNVEKEKSFDGPDVNAVKFYYSVIIQNLLQAVDDDIRAPTTKFLTSNTFYLLTVVLSFRRLSSKR